MGSLAPSSVTAVRAPTEKTFLTPLFDAPVAPTDSSGARASVMGTELDSGITLADVGRQNRLKFVDFVRPTH